MTSIKDVAREAGVSPATVSLVLNDKGSISEETRQRVLDTVRRLRYVRNSRASNLRKDQSRIIGYAQRHDRTGINPLMDLFLHELVREVEKSNRHILLFASREDLGVAVYQDLYESKRVDGFVLSYTEKDDQRFGYLYSENVPFVAFGRSLSELDDLVCWADVDGHAGLFAATTHLLDQGYRKIGLIGWPKGSASGDSRVQGWRAALQACELPCSEDYVERTLDSVDCGYEAARHLCMRFDDLEALACCSDSLALGALKFIAENQLSIAVTGFDDTPVAGFVGLTSVRQPVKEVAHLLVRMLFTQLQGYEVEEKQHLFTPELIVRSSTQF